MYSTAELHESDVYIKISPRRAIRQIREQKGKEVIQLHKRRKNLYKASKELPWIPVEKPYQSGWKRTFVCSGEVLKSPDAEFFKNILDRINRVQYSPYKDFRVGRRLRKRGQTHQPRLILNRILEENFIDKERGFGQREQKYFTLKEIQSFYRDYKVYEFRQPWRFVEKVFPHIVTHQRMLDADLESEMDFVEYQLISRKYHDLSIKHYGGKYWTRFRTGKEPHNILKNKPLHRICHEAKEF